MPNIFIGILEERKVKTVSQSKEFTVYSRWYESKMQTLNYNDNIVVVVVV